MHAHYTRHFPANGSTNPDAFQPKTFSIPTGIIPQNFKLLGFAVSEELGNKQTNKQTHSLTDCCFDREIYFFALSALQRNFSTTHPLGLYSLLPAIYLQTLSSLPSIIAVRDEISLDSFIYFTEGEKGTLSQRFNLISFIFFDIELGSSKKGLISLTVFQFSGKKLVESRSFFQPKTICIPGTIIFKNFSSQGFAVPEELGSKQSNTLTSYCFNFYPYNTGDVCKCVCSLTPPNELKGCI